MLNNLTNFFNLIRGRKIKTTLADSDLIAIGVRDSRFDGNYQPSAIKYEDFAAQQTVSVDGVTITGNGTPGNPLVAIGGGSLYSKTLFVDNINGNNATAVIGDPNKAYSTIAGALTVAAGMGAGLTNKVLIYIRRGTFTSLGNVFFINYVDFYCEPGVVFLGNAVFRDPSSGVVSNFLGYASFEGATLNVLELNYTSTVNFEFDYINCTGRAFGFLPTLGSDIINANIKGNYIYSQTFGTAYGITIRGNTNLTMDISRAIEALHTVVAVSNQHSGTVVINTPKIYLAVGNIYGGDAKNGIKLTSTKPTSNITINADIVNKSTVFYAGAQQGMVTFFGPCDGRFRLNGNIIAGPQLPFNGNNTVQGYCTVNGDTSSSWDYGIFTYGAGVFRFLNGNHQLESTSVGTAIVATNNTAETYFYNCSFYNPIVNKDLFVINSLTCGLYIHECTGEVVGGGTGYSVNTIVAGGTVGIHSSRFNLGLNPALTDLYSPTGLIVDANVQSLNF